MKTSADPPLVVATVAVPVGIRPTVPSGAWRRTTTLVHMTATRLRTGADRIGDRFTAWLRVESRVDRYASYAALGCALVATFLVVL